nr:vegetative incompatibility protein het-e-1 [Quercus suber]
MSLVYPSRVLDTNTFKLVRCAHDFEYAILSHRWYERNGQEELTFRQLEYTDLTATFADNEELRKSLNAMFQYYRQAKVCYSYLNDVVAERGSSFASDDPARAGKSFEWFTRGWTYVVT